MRGPEWSYDGDQGGLRGAAGRGERARSLDARRGGRDLHAAHQRRRPDGRAASGCTTSTRCSRPTTRRVRLDARGDADAAELPAQLGPLPGQAVDAGTFSYDFSNPEQMTFLLNSELSPAFMQDGRVSFTAEKATPDFYQLSGRRMNWDLTDYHPLLAQRAQSTSTFDNNLLPVGRLPGGDRDPRRARPQLPAHPVERRGARGAAGRWPPSTARSARSRPTAPTSPS